MFQWKLEDMRLMKEYDIRDAKHFRHLVLNTSRKDKIRFGDQMYDGLTTYVLDIVEKFKTGQEMILKNQRGQLHTGSFQSWLRHNEPKGVFTTTWPGVGYSVHPALKDRFIGDIKAVRYDAEYRDPVDQIFNSALQDCYEKEVQLYMSRDPYEIKKSKVIEMKQKHGFPFDAPIWFLPDDTIVVIHPEGAAHGNRKISEAELDRILEAYKIYERLLRNTHLNIEFKEVKV